ncbi:MAG: methyltransferase [Bacilli bacterium]
MEHYFTEDTITKSNIKKINIKIKNREYQFLTDNGVFSKKGLDFGTRTLLLNLPPLTGKVLDFGCGYGPIGIFIAKNNQVEMSMLDINKRSIELTKKNCELNQVKALVFLSNMYDDVLDTYDYIITNPPIRIGKKSLYRILFDAKKYLNKNGQLWLVINKNQGAKSLINDLKTDYLVDVINKNKGFYIIRARNC